MSARPGLPVGRLIAEFGVIVIGVLVALFLESAWEERAERMEEAEVLGRILDEVLADSTRLDRTGLWLDFVIPAAKQSVSILEGSDALPVTGRVAVLYAAATINTPTNRAWTWDELRETGRTNLIRDADLRRALALFFGESERMEERRNGLPGEYRAAILGLLPSDYAREILMECLREDPTSPSAAPRADAIRALEACTVAPAEVETRRLLDRLRARQELPIQAGRLAYELDRVRERLVIVRETRQDLLTALAASGASPR